MTERRGILGQGGTEYYFLVILRLDRSIQFNNKIMPLAFHIVILVLDTSIQRHDILIHKIEIYIIYRIDINFVILVLDTRIQLNNNLCVSILYIIL